MSYDLAILRPPIPGDDAAAWKAMHEIAEAQPEREVPQVFHQLIDRLTERYPCICDLPDEEVDNGVWSDGPLRNNAGHAITELGIVWSRVEEVQPFVIQTANDLGLVVFDPQEDRIYRPQAGGSSRPSTGIGKPWWKFWG